MAKLFLQIYLCTDSHIGDLGNLRVGDDGKAKIDITIKHPKRATLDKTSELTVLGRTLVIHKGKSCYPKYTHE